MYQASGITVKKKCIGQVQKKGVNSNSKVEASRIGREGQLIDRIVDKIQNYYGITVRASVGNLAGIEKTLFMPVSCTVLPASPSPLAAQVGASTSKGKLNRKSLHKHGPGLPWQVIALVKPE